MGCEMRPLELLICQENMRVKARFTHRIRWSDDRSAHVIQVGRNAVLAGSSAKPSIAGQGPWWLEPQARRGGFGPEYDSKKPMSEGRTLPAWLATFRSGLDLEAAPARYARRAPSYGAATASVGEVRSRAVDLVALLPGEIVFAVACDVGAVLCGLSLRMAPHVRVVFAEQSSEMAARSVESSGDSDSDNVCVLWELAKTFRMAVLALRVIFCYPGDVPQGSRAVTNLFARAGSFIRMSVAGLCLLPAWAAPVNAWRLWRPIHSLTPWGSLHPPQGPLVDWCPDLSLVERCHSGTGCLAAGTMRLH